MVLTKRKVLKKNASEASQDAILYLFNVGGRGHRKIWGHVLCPGRHRWRYGLCDSLWGGVRVLYCLLFYIMCIGLSNAAGVL